MGLILNCSFHDVLGIIKAASQRENGSGGSSLSDGMEIGEPELYPITSVIPPSAGLCLRCSVVFDC